VSYGKPEDREFHFQREHLAMELRTFECFKESYGLDKPHYIYVLKKNEGADERA